MKLGLPQVSEHKVVVLSTTYNQSKYIEDTLNGFAMQQTEFSFLCCVFDDASTDGEQGVLKSWIENHCNADEIETFDHPLTTILIAPDKDNLNCIYVFHLLKVNSYGKPEKAKLLNYWRQHGKYIALCEGDDYWTDPLKLQKQVDFLESHPDYVMCTHHYNEYIQTNNKIKEHPKVKSTIIDLGTLIHFSYYYFQPVTLLYKKSVFCTDEYNEYKITRDTVLFYYLLTKGKGYYINDTMAVYRRHTEGVWTGCNRIQQWMSDYGVRISIYQKEQTSEAAVFLINLFYEDIGRLWFTKNPNIIITILKIAKKHFGFGFALKCIIGRFIRLKNPFYDTIKSVKAFHLG